MDTIFLAHAERDHEFACRLAEYLELGCDAMCNAEEGLLNVGEDLIEKADQGLGADVLILLLSDASWPIRYPRERWEPVLSEQARRQNMDVAGVLLAECPFPGVLRRRNFFDAAADREKAMRLIKRWIWQRHRGGGPPELAISADLHDLYAGLSDRPGSFGASGEAASRFAREAGQEFEAVLWVPCHKRSLAEIAGELGVLLEARLEGPAEENCRRIRELLSERRCLLVLDAPSPDAAGELITEGRTSTLVTAEPVRVAETPATAAYGRSLVASRRYAEAYELFYALLAKSEDTESSARELTWICESWGRIDEANSLRYQYGTGPQEQLTLF